VAAAARYPRPRAVVLVAVLVVTVLVVTVLVVTVRR
jgi:hypothetical protein